MIVRGSKMDFFHVHETVALHEFGSVYSYIYIVALIKFCLKLLSWSTNLDYNKFCIIFLTCNVKLDFFLSWFIQEPLDDMEWYKTKNETWNNNICDILLINWMIDMMYLIKSKLDVIRAAPAVLKQLAHRIRENDMLALHEELSSYIFLWFMCLCLHIFSILAWCYVTPFLYFFNVYINELAT